MTTPANHPDLPWSCTKCHALVREGDAKFRTTRVAENSNHYAALCPKCAEPKERSE